MNDKYMQKVIDLLAQYDLTTDDLTKKELEEMLQEARDLENPDISIFDGYFGDPTHLVDITFRKSMK